MSSTATKDRMLFLSPVVPGVEGNGLAMRTGFLLDAYSRHFDIDIVIVPVAATSTDLSDFVRSRVLRTKVILPGSDTHFRLLSSLTDEQARLKAFGEYGQPSIAAGITDEVRRELEAWTGTTRYSHVHVSRLYLAPLVAARLGQDSDTRFILDCDENDARVQDRIAAMHRRNGGSLAADWASAEAIAFDRLAKRSLPQFDMVLAASDSEARSLAPHAGRARMAVVPNVVGAVPAKATARPRASVKTILFVGTLGYQPNADAVMWFASRMWPRLRHSLSNRVRLVIVGQDPPAEIRRLGRQSDVLVAGSVPAVAPFYLAADVAIAPLRAGGGTRIKLLEAASYGVPMVATTFGASGLEFRSGREILLADTEPKFAAACKILLTEPALALHIAGNARLRVRRYHDPDRWAFRVGQLAFELRNRAIR
jgi:polysaccharide biosynthesis protein PslH